MSYADDIEAAIARQIQIEDDARLIEMLRNKEITRIERDGSGWKVATLNTIVFDLTLEGALHQISAWAKR
jgi:hypothetical protein